MPIIPVFNIQTQLEFEKKAVEFALILFPIKRPTTTETAIKKGKNILFFILFER